MLMYGSGGNFSAGNDVTSFFNNDPPSAEDVAAMLFENVTFDKPVVYLVQGCCVGIVAT